MTATPRALVRAAARAPAARAPAARALAVCALAASAFACGGDLAARGAASPASAQARAAAECEAPRSGWIWCDDFERDRLARYFEYDNARGAFARLSGVGVDSSTGMRVRYDSGQVSVGSLHLAFGATPSSYIRPVDAGTARYTDLYWRLYLRLQPGWTGGGGDKLSRALVLASPQWAEAVVAPVWSGKKKDRNYLLVDPASGTDARGDLMTTKYNDTPRIRFLGLAPSRTAIFADASAGRWHCIEAHVRLNTPGVADGVFELWIDDAAEARRDRLNWRGEYTAYGLNALFVENYWNRGSPARQERYIDNLVVSTSRIGCLARGGAEER